MHPRRVAIALACLVTAAVLAAGCSGAGDRHPTAGRDVAAPEDTAPATPPADGDPVPAPLNWSPCHDEFECATLTVPLDYSEPAAGTIDLAVTRHRATDPAHRVASLIVNPGGPGGSGIAMVQHGFGAHLGLYEQLDVVSWDPRGVGASASLDCGAGSDAFLALDPGPDSPAEQSALDTAARAIAEDCEAHARPLLDHLATEVTVRDLEQLRRAIGDDRLTYAGYSYGSAIGLAYAERYPTRIRAMVLDGVVQPDQDLEQMLTNQTEAISHHLDEILARCATSAFCPLDDAAGTYDRIATRLEQHPLTADNGTSVGPAELAIAAVETTYDPALDARLWDALAGADRGNGSGIAGLADQYRNAVPDYVTYAAVTCVDFPHPVGADDYRAFAGRLAGRFPRVGAAIANEMLPCAFWPAPVVGRAHEPTEVTGGPPILVVGNIGDAVTPFSSATWVAEHLAGSVLLTYDGSGHTSGGRSSCIDDAVHRYLIDLVPPAVGTRCAADS
jgi:pimeloyl-ACP methyl ester carboxylesterase